MIFIWVRGSRGFGFIWTIVAMLGLAIVPVFLILGLTGTAYIQFATERSYEHQYGETWKSHFESDRGSLSDARTKATVCAGGAIVIGGLYVFLFKQVSTALRGRLGGTKGRRRRRRSSSHSRSPTGIHESR